MAQDPVTQGVEEKVKNNKIVIYMKGTKEAPQCGFSAATVDCFRKLNAPFETVDVLSDPLIREGIKQFTQWPTIPQVFIKGEFVGGYDIVRDLYSKGELAEMVKGAVSK